jgi:hypothetical protein
MHPRRNPAQTRFAGWAAGGLGPGHNHRLDQTDRYPGAPASADGKLLRSRSGDAVKLAALLDEAPGPPPSHQNSPASDEAPPHRSFASSSDRVSATWASTASAG